MRTTFLLFISCLLIFACSDDDGEIAPAYITTLAEIQTDGNGRPKTLIPDAAGVRTITSTHKALTPDSIYRVQVRALYDGEERAHLYQIANVVSPMPRAFSKDKRKYHPVELLSLWSSGRYINMRLALHTATEPHAFAFVEEGIDQLNDGTRRLRLHLYHDQGNNPEYYTRETYISCPIYRYGESSTPQEKLLTAGRDSIVFTVTTYKGEQTLRLLYQP
ncbi:MAG: hypothetical protein IKH52_04885 [Bacteroidaceae bacterium]|nr:hypothetical protein [Bacteroidaceae bacterium]